MVRAGYAISSVATSSVIAEHGDVARTRKPASKQSRTFRSTARTAPGVAAATKALALRVRALREAAGLSQEDAAERAGIGSRHWQVIESGKGNATIATCVAVARALGVGVDELFSASDGR